MAHGAASAGAGAVNAGPSSLSPSLAAAAPVFNADRPSSSGV
jgi:hypothetical protein